MRTGSGDDNNDDGDDDDNGDDDDDPYDQIDVEVPRLLSTKPEQPQHHECQQ